ncbi:MAG: D-alanyl-D-alanine carboxypeptidase [Clostridia bacterium]|nr:D-alanyl-D-alanine carboxypeptidase [Clostridia bacterium]
MRGIKKWGLWLLCLWLAACPAEGLSARSALVMEAQGGQVLFQLQPEERLPMASTTKLMTALLVLRHGDPDQRVRVPACAVGIEGSSLYLTEGEEISLHDLLCALLLRSANDAAVAAAVAIGGDEASFVALMNATAQELGMHNTHYQNPHGLHAQGHYTTAYDLALLMRACCEEPIFLQISGLERCIVQAGERGVPLVNHNKLLSLFPGVDSGKTGFTKAAGRCLVSSAVRDGLRLIAVTLNAPDDWNDHAELYELGFEQCRLTRVFEPGELRICVPVVGGVQAQAVLTNGETVVLPVQKGKEPVYWVEAPPFLYAPLKRGQEVGRLRTAGESWPLIAVEAVGREAPLTFWEKICHWLNDLFG